MVDLIDFIDKLYDLGAMVYNETANGFTPHGKAWFKGKVHAFMRRLSEQSNWGPKSFFFSKN